MRLAASLGSSYIPTNQQHTPTTHANPSMQVSFLTRDGCVNTPTMRDRLEVALTTVGVEAVVTVIDVATLDADDPLTGYGTPTILVGGFELFGAPLPRPAPPT